MTIATRRGIAALVLVALCPLTAHAWWFGSTDGGVAKAPSALETGAKKVIHWPSPYLCADRLHARSPFDKMIVNGWRRQNLLGSHHFNEDATKLTQSGKLKVQWIMTQAPEQHRQVFVERSLDQNVTDARMAAAQAFASQVARSDTASQVAETHLLSEGRPAATVDFVNTQFRENMPTPTLPEPTRGFQSGSN